MGSYTSHHEPLDRTNRTTSFRRANGLRHSKSKGTRTSPRAIDKLRRSFRSSFRRRKESISETSKPQIFQSDEADVRGGTCYFHVKYLGCVEVFYSRGIQICEEALEILKNSRRRPIKAILHVSGDGLRIVEDETKGLIVDQTLEKVSFCAPDRTNNRGFSYICRDGTTRRWLCHGFLAQRESGERLSHAVGCAFAICLEGKQKRDKECSVTMKFDLTNSTFTRTGSFRQPSLTQNLQDMDDVNKNGNTSLGSDTCVIDNNSQSSKTLATTVININNNINTNYNRKDDIPVKSTPNVDIRSIERPHATISMLQRQGSYRGLSHLNHASPFKRQLSLRLSDLSSNAERTRSRSFEVSYDPQVTTKTPANPIAEMSPSQDEANVADQVSAMCQQLSKELSFLANNDDLYNAMSGQTSFQRQPQHLQSNFSSSSSFLTEDFKSDETVNTTSQHSSLCNVESNANGVDSNKTNVNSSEKNSIVPPTPPQTPPNTALASLSKPEQWLVNVTQSDYSKPPSSFNTVTSSSISTKMTQGNSHIRSYSLSSAEMILNCTANDVKAGNSFNIDWGSLSEDPQPKRINTNPFLSNSPLKRPSDTAVKMFEVQM